MVCCSFQRDCKGLLPFAGVWGDGNSGTSVPKKPFSSSVLAACGGE